MSFRRVPAMVDGALSLSQLGVAFQILEDSAPGELVAPTEVLDWLRLHVTPALRQEPAGRPGRKPTLVPASARG